MNILKCQRNKFHLSNSQNGSLIKQISSSLNNNPILNKNETNKTFIKIKKNYFCDKIFKSYDKIIDKVNILTKHKSNIPERYMTMSPSLKIACTGADFPFYYECQNAMFQKIVLRTNNFNISLDKGEFFFMKNLLLLFNDHAVFETKVESFQINNVLICNDDKQIEFLEKIQSNFLIPTNGVVKDVNDPLFNQNLERNFPPTLIISKENFIKLVKKFTPEKIFNKKCLFFLYKLNTEDKGSLSFSL